MTTASDLTEHLQRLRHYALKLAKNPALADDLVQETMVRALSSLDKFDGANMGGWVTTIMQRTWSNMRRTQARKGVLSLTKTPETEKDYMEPVALTVPATQEMEVSTQKLKEAFEVLPAAYRETMVLRCVEDCSYKEIAAQQGVPVGTVMSRIRRGREILKTQLADVG